MLEGLPSDKVALSDAIEAILRERCATSSFSPTLDERAEAMANHIQYLLDDWSLYTYEKHILVRILLRDETFRQYEVFRSCCALLLSRFHSTSKTPVDLSRVGKVMIFVSDLLRSVLPIREQGQHDDELTF